MICRAVLVGVCVVSLASACASEPAGATASGASTGTQAGTSTGAGEASTGGSASSGGSTVASSDGSTDGGSGSSGAEPTSAGSTGAVTSGPTEAGATTEAGSSGGDGLGAAAEAAVAALEEAVIGVLWLSESDYPWTVFALVKAAPVTSDNVKALVGALVIVDGEPPLAEQRVEEEPWTQRFDAMTTPQPWWGDYEVMRAQQYTALRAVLEAHLVEIKTFRIGPDSGGMLLGAIDMFVIGETVDGDLVGIQTVSVET